MYSFIKKTIVSVLCVFLLTGSIVANPTHAKATASEITYVSGENPISKSYENSIYYSNLKRVSLTGDGVTDVLAVALTQLGYTEGSDEDFSGKANGYSNFTEYNYNMGDFGFGYGTEYYLWGASFVSWALLQSGCTNQNLMSDWCRNHKNEPEYIWREVGFAYWAKQLREQSFWEYSSYFGGDYTAKSGDLIFFTETARKNRETQMGIVLYSDDETVYVIQGDTSDNGGFDREGNGVYLKSYPLKDKNISGYGIMPYEKKEGVLIDYSGKNATVGLYISNSVKKVYAKAEDSESVETMDRFTMFEVVEIAQNGRLKAIFKTVDGETVTGYIDNDDERVVQLTSTASKAGDVDFDNDVDAADYILVKRAVLKTYELSEKQTKVADIDFDNGVDAADYVLVKRIVLGTYKA